MNAANLIAALPLCSLSSNTHSAALRSGEASLVTYYEDPRRFSSRVIGLSFQGPRGRTFLPSGSRCLVSLVFAVKDFRNFSFHRFCFRLFVSAAFLRGIQGLQRVAVFSPSRLSRQGIFETFFSPLSLRVFFSCISAGLEAPKRVAVSSLRRLCCQRLC